MKNLIRIISLIIFAGFTTASFAAGDYIWEEKFNRELPKAEQGNAKSQYAVGEMYEKGKGAERDIKKAFKWYSKAAKQDNKKAAYKVGLAYLEGKGTKKNYKLAYKWLQKSASKKYVRAQYYLGVIFENGRGVTKNYGEAMKWYKRALAGGYGSAADGINRVARAQKAPEPKRAAAVVAKPKPKAKPKAVPKTTKQKVLAGGWKRRNKYSEYLPSSINQCKDQGKRIECVSEEQKRNIGMADINYTTKAILFAFSSNGKFKVSYRNNVSKIKVTDAEFEESGGKVPVSLGWQDAEHQLVCKFENDRSLVCTKNKTRKMKFRR